MPVVPISRAMERLSDNTLLLLDPKPLYNTLLESQLRISSISSSTLVWQASTDLLRSSFVLTYTLHFEQVPLPLQGASISMWFSLRISSRFCPFLDSISICLSDVSIFTFNLSSTISLPIKEATSDLYSLCSRIWISISPYFICKLLCYRTTAYHDFDLVPNPHLF